MIAQFPTPQDDELLGSILARFIDRQGIVEDKVALDLLFGSRTVVPSPLFQGHLRQLLQHIGDIWRTEPERVISRHTLLPIFQPFVPRDRYQNLVNDLTEHRINSIAVRSGLCASNLAWPQSYRYCPFCWRDQQQRLGFTYWQRLFQCPGVECCPEHQCRLSDSSVSLQSDHRHRFVGTRGVEVTYEFKDAPMAEDLALAGSVKQLLSGHYEPPSVMQWTQFYQQLARNEGLVIGSVIDHKRIARTIVGYWGEAWLQKNGLSLQGADHWVIRLFRKHRRPFSYLQHLVCCEAIGTDFSGIGSVLDTALTYPCTLPKKIYTNSKAAERREMYQSEWRRLRSHFGDSLSAIRASQEGARVYSWLYRFDRAWYEENKPQALLKAPFNRVDWGPRDRALVRQMLKIEYRSRYRLEGPRRSRKWFARQVWRVSWIDKKLDKLPLCKAFFVAYAESIEEYQTRRIAAAMVRLRQSPRFRYEGIATHVVERASGLSKERCRQPAREILRLDLKAWQGPSLISSVMSSCRYRSNSSV